MWVFIFLDLCDFLKKVAFFNDRLIVFKLNPCDKFLKGIIGVKLESMDTRAEEVFILLKVSLNIIAFLQIIVT